MPEIQQLAALQPIPGIQRDGTAFDVKQLTYIDGEWVRFQRGKPRKMGGYIRISDRISGPVRASIATPYNNTARLLSFSPSGIESVFVDENGLGSYIVNRTPSGFSYNADNMWSVATMYDDAAGADQSIVIAAVSVTGDSVDSTNEGPVYYGNIFDEDTAFEVISGVVCRGLFVTQPYAVYYGANGKVTWSNANEPRNVTTGDAGSDRITALGIVAGLPLPTGSGPGGLLWSLDSVIRMEWVGGQAIFRFNRLTASSSILSQNTVVEMDGIYYWIGNDKFYVCEGNTVKELPNNTNRNWFFESLNYSQRSKVWATRNTSFGEIIWYFPDGENDECTKAIVFNAKENCWYDYTLGRTSGTNYWARPVQYSTPTDDKLRIEFTVISGSFGLDDIVYSTGRAQYKIYLIDDTRYYLERLTTGEPLVAGEALFNESGGTASIDTVSDICGLYLHEFGVNKVEGDYFYALNSSITTSDISLMSIGNAPMNNWTRVIRIEPDFVQSGQMNVELVTKEFANSSPVSFGPYTFTESTEKIDMRVQGRIVYVKFSSNVAEGDYQMGRVLVHLEPGDVRS